MNIQLFIAIFAFISGIFAQNNSTDDLELSDDFKEMIPNAAYKNKLETVKKMVLEGGRNASEIEQGTGYNGLHYSAVTGNVEIFKFLLAQGANPFVATVDRYARLPLHIASQWGRTEIVKVLLGLNGTNVNAKSGEGETPLTILADSPVEYRADWDVAPVDFKSTLRALLAAGADKAIKNGNGKRAAELAAEKPELLNILNAKD